MGDTTVDVVRHGLHDQLPHELCLSFTKQNGRELENTGKLIVNAQYKFTQDADPVYKAFLALQSKSWSVAIRLATTSLQIFPVEYRLFLARAEAYLSAREADLALADAEKAIQFAPKCGDAYYFLGMALFEKMDHASAREALQKGLALAPLDQRLLRALDKLDVRIMKQKIKQSLDTGKAAFGAKRYEDALFSFSKAIKNNPQNGSYYIYRALTHLMMLKMDSAASDVRSAVALRPDWCQVDCNKTGYLLKQAKVKLIMKRRFVCLKDHFLVYMKADKGLVVKGIICLHTSSSVLKARTRNQFTVQTTTKNYEFKADSDEETLSWISSIDKAIHTPISITTDQNENQFWSAESKSMKPRVGEIASAATSLGDKIRSRLSTIPMASADMSGFLHKMGQVNTSWKRRFFLLKGSTLYYTDLSNENPSQLDQIQPIGTIDLSSRVGFAPAGPQVHKDFAFELRSPYRKYFLAAESKEKYLLWKAALLKVVGESAHGGSNYEFLEEPTDTGDAPLPTPTTFDTAPVTYTPGHITTTTAVTRTATLLVDAAINSLPTPPSPAVPASSSASSSASAGASGSTTAATTGQTAVCTVTPLSKRESPEGRYFSKIGLENPGSASLAPSTGLSGLNQLFDTVDDEVPLMADYTEGAKGPRKMKNMKKKGEYADDDSDDEDEEVPEEEESDKCKCPCSIM
ncbi:hypothetical protein Pelo_13600 [Pelomyxa schiedti]|nr:hypothetical protein Pelo_13600 [Pelomyxa schiedti]